MKWLASLGEFMQTGAFDVTAPHPMVPGCFGGVCDGQYFQEAIRGRTPAEIAAAAAAAKAYFRDRFGIDVDDPANAGRVQFNSFLIDPRAQYRAYSFSGAKVPSEGWVVHDGGLAVLITDPEGFVLGGPTEWAGVRVAAGTFLVAGEYVIFATNPAGKPIEPIVIPYRSGTPMVFVADGSFHFVCLLQHPEWGSGLAQGISRPVPLPDGRVQFNVRTVMTFPGLGDAAP